ncbi:YbjN domain-containing protein [Pseudanabaena mucicola]|uniref:YbjN domain-containing protein n=1 Tax=Pseudanabaena mucicola TaxID=71190 RepID=UPI002574D579|nr:YbjN domain-containing protein [Pseudanabaena mucicola]
MAKLAATTEIQEKDQNSMLEIVTNFFKENNWSFSQHETEPILQMGYQGENGNWTCIVRIREAQSQVVFYSVCPVNIPLKKRLAIAEFLTRVNFGLIVGNFEMDFQDGEVRYKTYAIKGENNPLNSELIGQLIFVNVMTMDKYLPALMSVLYANVPIDQAIQQIE